MHYGNENSLTFNILVIVKQYYKMKKTIFIIIFSLTLTTIVSSCNEDDITTIDCNGILDNEKSIDEIKSCTNGKWKVIRTFNIYGDWSITKEYIEFKSDSISIIYVDSNIIYSYPIEWIKYDKRYKEGDTINYRSAYKIILRREQYRDGMGLVDLKNDTLTISEFRPEGPSHTLVRVEDFTQ